MFGGLGFGGTLTKIEGKSGSTWSSATGVVIELNRPAGKTALLGLGVVLGEGASTSPPGPGGPPTSPTPSHTRP